MDLAAAERNRVFDKPFIFLLLFGETTIFKLAVAMLLCMVMDEAAFPTGLYLS